jgi:hypothetical protein
MHIHLKIIGFVLMALALVHVIFPRYFHWKEELKNISLMNRQMMKVHTFFIALTVFLMGLLCATYTDDIIGTHFGRIISLGFGIFWFFRLVIQFFGYSSELWKGKTFETIVHIIFALLWAYLSVVFLSNFQDTKIQ